MLGPALQFLGGLILLLIGGRLLVSASEDTARRLGVPPLVVGLTLVAWGTSAPELALNLISAGKGRSDLAVGNVVGANVCNMAMVLGVAALIRPLLVQERLIRVEIWLNAVLLVFMAALGVVAGYQRWEPGLMLFAFGLYSMWTVMAALRRAERSPGSAAAAGAKLEDPANPPPPMSWTRIAAFFAVGLVLLSTGGSLASDGASGIALKLGIPAAIVGVTIVSIGTTLPELITSVLAVRRGQTDLAMGNAIGSCLFNAGAIFGLVGLITPPPRDPELLIPLIYMGVLAVALVPISRSGGKRVSRIEGALLLGSYAVFLAISAVRAAAT
jgi:cation:H+ antiporter